MDVPPSTGVPQRGLLSEQAALTEVAVPESPALFSLLNNIAPIATPFSANPMLVENAFAPGLVVPLGSLLVSESPATRRLLDQVFLTSAANRDNPAGQSFAVSRLDNSPNDVLAPGALGALDYLFAQLDSDP
jgi:hypothetical protein